MHKRIKIVFLLLILLQGLHSVEEYYGGLWEVLTPARIVSEAVSSNPEVGFIIINTGLFIFGLLCWLLSSRQKKISYQALIWIWIVAEVFNGIGHPLLTLRRGNYFPGLYSAPFLLVTALYLARLLLTYSSNLPRHVSH